MPGLHYFTNAEQDCFRAFAKKRYHCVKETRLDGTKIALPLELIAQTRARCPKEFYNSLDAQPDQAFDEYLVEIRQDPLSHLCFYDLTFAVTEHHQLSKKELYPVRPDEHGKITLVHDCIDKAHLRMYDSKLMIAHYTSFNFFSIWTKEFHRTATNKPNQP